MTLDEAIKICEEDAKLTWNGKPTVAAEECQQMVEWLRDYKRLLGAIEDIRAEIDEQYDIVKRDNIYCADGLEIALGIIDRHIGDKKC